MSTVAFDKESTSRIRQNDRSEDHSLDSNSFSVKTFDMSINRPIARGIVDRSVRARSSDKVTGGGGKDARKHCDGMPLYASISATLRDTKAEFVLCHAVLERNAVQKHCLSTRCSDHTSILKEFMKSEKSIM